MHNKVTITVVVPAYNEEHFIGKCLQSINQQQLPPNVEVETIVVLNRCTDATESIALEHGARLIRENAKNISKIRNAGVHAASGEWVVTIDADSWMSAHVLSDIVQHAQDPKVIGGGIKIRPERWSLGIAAGYAAVLIPAFFMRLSYGLYWFRRTDFLCIQGFNENLYIAEDLDFLHRLKRHGKNTQRRCIKITSSRIVTSCRKFDQFGDWHFLRLFGNLKRTRQAAYGKNQHYLDKNWYEVRSNGKDKRS